jgi:dynein heavy chain, axonemal
VTVQVFVTAHESVSDKSKEMFEALKRQNYVTPTNYLEFVEGYKLLLGEKQRALSDKAGKLRGGLTKLDETTVQVGQMQACASRRSSCIQHHIGFVLEHQLVGLM